MFHCERCKERWFLSHTPGNKEKTICKRCYDNIEKKGSALYDDDNDQDPFPTGCPYPLHLPTLTEIEEMLIARVHVIMKCCRLHNGAVGYSGQVLNIKQDVQGFIDDLSPHLPHKPNETPIVIV